MQTYRARSSLVWGGLCVLLGSIIAIADVAAHGVTGAKVGLGVGASIALIGTAAFLRPVVGITTDTIIFRNVVQTTSAPLARIQDFSMTWSFEMHGDDGMKAGSFAVPASRDGHTGVFGAEPTGTAASYRAESAPGSIAEQVYVAWRARQDASGEYVDQSRPSMTRHVDGIGLGLVMGAIASLIFAVAG